MQKRPDTHNNNNQWFTLLQGIPKSTLNCNLLEVVFRKINYQICAITQNELYSQTQINY